MLDKKMSCTNLAFSAIGTVDIASGSRGVMLSHVKFEPVSIGTLRWFPSGFMSIGVEVIRQVLGVRVSDLPLWWKPGICLRNMLDWESIWWACKHTIVEDLGDRGCRWDDATAHSGMTVPRSGAPAD